MQLNHTTSHNRLLESPSLLLSQCCGPELFQQHAQSAIPIAAPIISAYRVAPGHYFSHIVTTESAKLDQLRVAVNSRSSHSGYSAVKQWLSKMGIEDYSIYETGSHQQSVRELQAGRANLAAVDALSWRFLDSTGLTVLDNSEPVFAPPFIMGSESKIPRELLSAALNNAFKRHGKPMGITGAISVTKRDYQSLAVT